MGKFLEKNLTIILLSIIGYFLFSISSSLKESARYDADLRACAKMKAYMNDKESSKLFEQEAASLTGVKVKFVGEYCKKLTLQNFFWSLAFYSKISTKSFSFKYSQLIFFENNYCL